MFSSGPNYTKLKTNLRLAINRLKLLEKKKTELALKARKEIADYISTGKLERAKIRVEHIIREDYLVEAMEVTEMYCDLILARFGLIQQMKDLDEGLAEAISSLIWAAPRLMTDVAELKLIADQFSLKYGKPYAQACREQQVATISERLIHKLSVQAPPKILVEKYLVEIAKNYNIEYEPDPQIMREGEPLEPLINLDDKNNLGGGGGGGGDGGMNVPPVGFPASPNMMPGPPGPIPTPFSYPQQGGVFNLPNVPGSASFGGDAGGYNFPPSGPPPADPGADPLPPKNPNMQSPMGPGANFASPGAGTGTGQWDEIMGLDNSPPPPYTSITPSGHTGGHMGQPTAPPPSIPPAAGGHPAGGRPLFPPDMGANVNQDNVSPKPAPRSKFGEEGNDSGAAGFNLPDLPNIPDLPSVPGGNSVSGMDDTNEDIDFDDLTKRFEHLKKKK